MGYFNRGGSSAIQYHSYVPDSPSLINIGLASYTRNSFEDFGYKKTDNGKELDDDIKEYFNGAPPLSLLGDRAELSILYYDVENNRYLLRTNRRSGTGNIFYSPSGNNGAGGNVASNLKDFQTKWDYIQKGFAKDIGLSDIGVYAINDVYSNIKNSLSGCITFKTPNYSILGCSENTVVKIYFTSTGKNSTEREVATRGVPTFVVEPRDSAFQPYSHRATNSLPPGESAGSADGGVDNPNNTVAAQPRYRYDNVSGKVEFGTFQTLATLLEDLPGIDTPDLPDNIDALSHDRYVLNDASTALALPLTSHNGNPKVIAPNSYDCGGFKKQKILVTNITPRSYVKGDLVICSLVNGIWVPMGYKDPSLAPKKLNIEWSDMQQYMVNAHSFFRDKTNTQYINSEEYIGHFRYRYYMQSDLDSRTKTLNMLNITSEDEVEKKGGLISLKNNDPKSAPNYNVYLHLKKPVAYGYLSVCDADRIHTSLGGNNTTDNFYLDTNLDQMQIDDPENNIVYALSCPFNWGMFFPKGYTSVSVSKLKNYTGSISTVGATAIDIDIENGIATPGNRSAIYAGSGKLDFTRKTAFNIADRNLYHFPAQMALNSKDKPTKNYSNIWTGLYGGTSSNYYTYSKSLDFGKSYGEYLIKSDGSSLYDLKPISPQNIHFYPLQLELALSDTFIDYGSSPPLTYNQDGYLNLDAQIAAGWGKVLPTMTSKGTRTFIGSGGRILAFGNMWNRNYITLPVVVRQSNPKITSSIGFSKNDLLDHRTIPPSLKPEVTYEYPVGGPNLFPPANGSKERSNVVGILGAKATVSLANGGQINLTTDNRFGSRSYSITTISGGGVVNTIIGALVAFSTDLSGTNRDISIKQWGSSNEGKPNAFGTTALFCKVYDHYDNVIYDARYFTPLHFNPSSGVAFNEPNLPIGSIINADNSGDVEEIENNIRTNQLISGGGFSYIKKYIGIDPKNIIIENAGVGYQNEKVRLKFGGNNGALFKVDVVNGAITLNNLEIIDNGEFSAATFSDPLQANILAEVEGDEVLYNDEAKITVRVGTVMEKLMNDPSPEYTEVMLTPSSNRGGGENKGIVNSTLTKSVSLDKNSTGKYDFFFFFANDIIHTHLTNESIAAYDSFFPAANYVKLDISAG